MISYEEALNTVLAHVSQADTELIPFDLSMGRILREPLIADRDLPPYDRVTMDGIAINAESAGGQLEFQIEGVAAAGEPQHTLKDRKACLEIMTGAPLPHNTDTIIRYEDVEIEAGKAQLKAAYKIGQNIHRKGEDRIVGAVLSAAGVKISSAEIGIMAAIGKARISVSKLPRTIIISTGDELINVSDIPLPHQIRRSNVYQIKCRLAEHGIQADMLHVNDDESELQSSLEKLLHNYDVILMSGGVSKGKFDYVPEALTKLGVVKHFHRVAQRPGKPFWFGTYPQGCTVFALPGNPVSSFVCTLAYVEPWLRKWTGQTAVKTQNAVLAAPVSFPKPLEYFMEVALRQDETGIVHATPMKGQGSGDFANLLRADAIMRFPAQRDSFEVGEVFPIYLFRT